MIFSIHSVLFFVAFNIYDSTKPRFVYYFGSLVFRFDLEAYALKDSYS